MTNQNDQMIILDKGGVLGTRGHRQIFLDRKVSIQLTLSVLETFIADLCCIHYPEDVALVFEYDPWYFPPRQSSFCRNLLKTDMQVLKRLYFLESVSNCARLRYQTNENMSLIFSQTP